MADFYFEAGEKRFIVSAEAAEDGFVVRIGDETVHVRAAPAADGQLNLIIDGVRHQAFVVEGSDPSVSALNIWLNGRTWSLLRTDARQPRRRGGAGPADNVLTAAMPGQVRELLAAPGDKVAAGAPLLLLEAMKMEMRITAPTAGTVTAVMCAVGDVVARGQPLIEIDYGVIEVK